MEMAQEIELEAYEKHKEELDNPEVDAFYLMIDNLRKMPKRNNFRSMIELLDEYDELADFIIELRNSIAHNRYPKPYRISSKAPDVKKEEDMAVGTANSDGKEQPNTANNTEEKGSTDNIITKNPYTKDIPKETEIPQIFETFEKKLAEATKK